MTARSILVYHPEPGDAVDYGYRDVAAREASARGSPTVPVPPRERTGRSPASAPMMAREELLGRLAPVQQVADTFAIDPNLVNVLQECKKALVEAEGDATRAAMKKTLADIQSGKFAQEWIAENKAGCPNFNKLREKEKQHPIEIIGAQLRGMMSWLSRILVSITSAMRPSMMTLVSRIL